MSLVGYSPQDCKDLDMTEQLSTSCCLRPGSIPSEDLADWSPTGFREAHLYLAPVDSLEKMLGNIRFIRDRRPREATQTPQRLRPWGPGATACWAVGGGLEVASPLAKTAGSADREEP